MTLIANWDDLLHGTIVFGALVPLAVAFALGWFQPSRLGLATALALAASFLWFFGLPSLRFGSDDAVPWALVVASLIVALDTLQPARPPLTATRIRGVLSVFLWAGLAWMLYPAWLALDGGVSRQLLVAGLVAASITGFSLVCAHFTAERPHPPTLARLTPAAFLPLAIALSILLILGGATRFAQSAGAVASTLGAICLVLLAKPAPSGIRHATWLSAMLLSFLAWAGWLFAELQPLAAALLFFSPFVALTAHCLPLPRQKPLLVMAWDGLTALLAVAPVLAVVIVEYLATAPAGY